MHTGTPCASGPELLVPVTEPPTLRERVPGQSRHLSDVEPEPLRPLEGVPGRFDAPPAYEGRHRYVEGRHRAPGGDEPQPFNLGDYDSLLFYSRQLTGRKAKRAAAVFRRLQLVGKALDIEVTHVPTSASMVENTVSLSQRAEGRRSIVAAYGGDGTHSMFLEVMQNLGLENPVMLVEGGHKGDIVRQVITKILRKHPERLLTAPNLQLRKLSRLLVTMEVEGADGNVDVATGAFGYASEGMSAATAADMNGPFRTSWLRKLPFGVGTYVGERALLGKQYARAKSAQLSINNEAVKMNGRDSSINDEGVQPYIDLTVANGASMAGNLKPDQDIFTPGAQLIISHNRRHAIGVIGRLLRSIPVGRKLQANQTTTIYSSSPVKSRVQVDGEDIVAKLKSVNPTQSNVNVITAL